MPAAALEVVLAFEVVVEEVVLEVVVEVAVVFETVDVDVVLETLEVVVGEPEPPGQTKGAGPGMV